MAIQLSTFMRNAKDLIRNNKKVRYALYAILILATLSACFGLGERFGRFLYILTH